MRSLPSMQSMVFTLAFSLVTSHGYAQTENNGQLPTLPAQAASAAPTQNATAPAVNLPAAPAAPAPVAAAAPAPAPASPAAVSDIPALVGIGGVAGGSTTTRFSFGDSDVSILFLPAQTQVMKQALTNFESRPLRTAPVEKVKEPTLKLDVIAEPHVTEPETYPVFYLSSIVYHSSSDWSLWVSGHKITSAKNPTDIKVAGISAEQATFTWTPGYSEALALRKQHKTFADTDKVKHRLSAIQNSSYDDNTGVVTFTLRPNQTFAVGYFRTFEGYMTTPKLEAALPASAAVATPAPPAVTQAPPPSMDEVLQPKTIGDVLKSKDSDQEKGAE